MFVKSFMFSKLAKTPITMSEKINDFLKDVNFKFATHTENQQKGSLVVTVYYTLENVGLTTATVIKSGNVETLDESLQLAIDEKDLRFSTQSYAQGNIYSIVYTQPKSNKNGNKKAK